MKSLARFRVFADHYQFILCDADADPLHEVPKWTKATLARGYVASDSAAFISSRAHLNDIVVKVEFSNRPAEPERCDRNLSFKMSIPSGRLQVTDTASVNARHEVRVDPGDYEVQVLSFNLGADEMKTGELLKPGRQRMTDAQRFARDDFEHHRVVLKERPTRRLADPTAGAAISSIVAIPRSTSEA